MSNFKEYYRNLLNWEGIKQIELIHPWPKNLRIRIISSFVRGIELSALKGSICKLRERSTNQSVGNQVEALAIAKLAPHMPNFSLTSCSGSGYPDKTLIDKQTELKMPLEVKATSDWNPKDHNRRVLTSSSAKVRKQFTGNIYHMLLTFIYTRTNDQACIDNIRLDFLEPDSPVGVRLEASVNHKLLSKGEHVSQVW